MNRKLCIQRPCSLNKYILYKYVKSRKKNKYDNYCFPYKLFALYLIYKTKQYIGLNKIEITGSCFEDYDIEDFLKKVDEAEDCDKIVLLYPKKNFNKNIMDLKSLHKSIKSFYNMIDCILEDFDIKPLEECKYDFEYNDNILCIFKQYFQNEIYKKIIDSLNILMLGKGAFVLSMMKHKIIKRITKNSTSKN